MMITRKARILPVLAFVLAALVFTGCSTDGDDEEPPHPPTEWTLITDGPFGTTAIQKVVFGNSKFVATGNGGTAWYSADGITWTESSDTAALGSSNLSGLTFGSGKFLTTGGSSGNTDWAYSTDGGDTWTATGSQDTNFNAKGLAYGNGVYVIGGSSGRIAYSDDPADADSWIILESTGTTFNKEGRNGFVNGMVFGDGKFVAAGSNYGHTAYSTDGTTWTAITQTEEIFNTWINGIAYGDGKFVTVGEGDTAKIAFASASDITNWTSVENPKLSGNGFAIAYGGGYFVAIQSNSSNAAYSKDGIYWTAIGDTAFAFGTDAINGVTYGNGKFVIVGANGKVAYASVN